MAEVQNIKVLEEKVIPTVNMGGVYIPKQQPKNDPAIDPIEAARAKSERDVDEIVDHAIMEIGKARDELDSLMNDLGESRQDIKARIQQLASYSVKAIRAKNIIANSLIELRSNKNNGAD